MRHGWGGRGSDKHVTEKSGLLNKLLPGDLVLVLCRKHAGQLTSGFMWRGRLVVYVYVITLY